VTRQDLFDFILHEMKFLLLVFDFQTILSFLIFFLIRDKEVRGVREVRKEGKV